jgi:hypothetical protein
MVASVASLSSLEALFWKAVLDQFTMGASVVTTKLET